MAASGWGLWGQVGGIAGETPLRVLVFFFGVGGGEISGGGEVSEVEER